LITSEKRGREVYVSVVPEALEALSGFFSIQKAEKECCRPASNLVEVGVR
jgi:hypothetical protein